jgi:Arc/MetJ family transcription regulator
MEAPVRTNIEIDDELIAEAMAATGLKTKKATVEEALRRLVRNQSLKQTLAELDGIGWEGNLEAMRLNDSDQSGR